MASVTAIIDEVKQFLESLRQELPDTFAPPPPAPSRSRAPKPMPPDGGRKEEARKLLDERLRYWSSEMGLTFNKVSVKDQRSLWGSCSRKGNLNFNWRLILAPLPVLDYIVIHELAHLKEMNHSPRFWEIVRNWSPDYRSHRKWLRANQQALFAA